ncbi:MAG: hypothetical protein K0A90_09035, partial [Methanosarcinaceae archaeon]|nr:hypothetical protein [Methanosarcinaceae archaeon]
RTVKNRDYADFNSKDFDALGAGEQECMMLCKNSQKNILLINDKKERQIATSSGISVLNISAFLLACKRSNFIDNDEMSRIVDDLKEKDYFEFSKDDLDNLNL